MDFRINGTTEETDASDEHYRSAREEKGGFATTLGRK